MKAFLSWDLGANRIREWTSPTTMTLTFTLVNARPRADMNFAGALKRGRQGFFLINAHSSKYF